MGKNQRARRHHQAPQKRCKQNNDGAIEDNESQEIGQNVDGKAKAVLLSPELAAALGQDEEGGGDAIISAKNAGQGGIRRKRDSRGNLIEPEVRWSENLLIRGHESWLLRIFDLYRFCSLSGRPRVL